MPLLTSFFSSAAAGSSSRRKNSHLKRFINNISKPSQQYVPDIYDDLRDDGFYFRPSDTYTGTAFTSSLNAPPTQTAAPAQASKSTPNLHHGILRHSDDELYELSSLPVPRKRTTGYRHSTELSRDSAISFASLSSATSNETAATSTEVHELATLPSTVYTPPPRRSSLAAARQHALRSLSGEYAASTPCLPFELPAQDMTIRCPATAKARIEDRTSAHAHAPARPSPLKLATLTSRRPSEDVPIMLSPRTAAFEKALPPLPLGSNPVTPGSGFAFKRKPVATPVVCSGGEEEFVELPLPELDNGHALMVLPGLPSRLSRLETLRHRLSLVVTTSAPTHPVSSDAATTEEKDVKVLDNFDELKRNFTIRTYQSTLSLADINMMGDLGAVARRKRGGSAGSDGSALSTANAEAAANDAYARDEEVEIDEAVEIGTAKWVGGVTGAMGCAKMVSSKDSESDSGYEVNVKKVGRVVKGVKGENKEKSMVRARQREEGVVGWWHTRGA